MYMTKSFHINPILSKPRTSRGVKYEGSPLYQMTADIEKDHWIHIKGTMYSGLVVDKIFHLGDYAEYNSYNMRYYGKIVAISEKCVTIEERYGYNGSPRRHRLSIYQFTYKNYNFEIETVKKENSEVMMSM